MAESTDSTVCNWAFSRQHFSDHFQSEVFPTPSPNDSTMGNFEHFSRNHQSLWNDAIVVCDIRWVEDFGDCPAWVRWKFSRGSMASSGANVEDSLRSRGCCKISWRAPNMWWWRSLASMWEEDVSDATEKMTISEKPRKSRSTKSSSWILPF